MSTRSRIGILNDDGSVTSIYCHSDGYAEGPHCVGYKLEMFWGESVRQLLALDVQPGPEILRTRSDPARAGVPERVRELHPREGAAGGFGRQCVSHQKIPKSLRRLLAFFCSCRFARPSSPDASA